MNKEELEIEDIILKTKKELEQKNLNGIIETNSIYYVYCLMCPKTRSPFYIGKGKSDRIYSHELNVKRGVYPNNNKHLFNKIKSILNNGHNIIYKKYIENCNEYIALEIEKEIIKLYRNKHINLCNIATGGIGGNTWEHNPNKEIIREKCKTMLGKKFSIERRNNISNGLKRYARNNVHYMKGYKHTAESKRKLSEINNDGRTAVYGDKNPAYKNLNDIKNIISDLYLNGFTINKIKYILTKFYRRKVGYCALRNKLIEWKLYEKNIKIKT